MAAHRRWIEELSISFKSTDLCGAEPFWCQIQCTSNTSGQTTDQPPSRRVTIGRADGTTHPPTSGRRRSTWPGKFLQPHTTHTPCRAALPHQPNSLNTPVDAIAMPKCALRCCDVPANIDELPDPCTTPEYDAITAFSVLSAAGLEPNGPGNKWTPEIARARRLFPSSLPVSGLKCTMTWVTNASTELASVAQVEYCNRWMRVKTSNRST